MTIPKPVDEYLGQQDEHTGVSAAYGIPYIYQKTDSLPDADPDVYRVTCYSEYADEPMHRNVYFVPAKRLDFFFDGWGQSGERIVDIRPTTWEEAESEMSEYREE